MKMLPRPKEPGPAGPTVKPASQNKQKGLGPDPMKESQAHDRYETMKRGIKHQEQG